MEKIEDNFLKKDLEFYRRNFIKITQETTDPHFAKINSEELTEKDLQMFKDFSENEPTFEAAKEYLGAFKEYKNVFAGFPAGELENNSSYWFSCWLANKFTSIWLKRQMEEKLKNKK